MTKKAKKSNNQKKKAPSHHPHSASSPKALPVQQPCQGSSAQSIIGGCETACRHLEKGLNINMLSSQLTDPKSAITQCHDCLKDAKSKKGKKNKGKPLKNKMAQFPANRPTKMWICLSCGHVGCGTCTAEDTDEAGKEIGVGSGHALKHWSYTKHHLALLVCEDKLACWCFQCKACPDGSLVESSVVDSNSREQTHLTGSGQLQHVGKLVWDKLAKESGKVKKYSLHCSEMASDEETLCEVASDSNLLTAIQAPLPLDGYYVPVQRKRIVKGLVNLGNTCFFNAVIQNLLALNLLRDYFCLEPRVPEGPLTSSLRKLFLETNDCDSRPVPQRSEQIEVISLESGLKKAGKGRLSCDSSNGTAYNPRSLFGTICSKAPRFRGFQQQDSHELLRCLLDGLHTEEQGTRVAVAETAEINKKDAGAEGISEIRKFKHIDSHQLVTVVDNFFGGQLSSRVCCCKCGHSSVVYEPFLDLSLPIPANRAPKKNLEKKKQTASSSLPGKLEKGKNRRYLDKSGTSPSNLQPSTPMIISVINDCQEPELQLVPSAVTIQKESSATLEKSDFSNSNAIDDFGWLDYLEGGMQSAEGSLQGPRVITANARSSRNPNICTNNLDAPQDGSRSIISLSDSNFISYPVTLEGKACLCSLRPSDPIGHEVVSTEKIVGNLNRHDRNYMGVLDNAELKQDMNVEADSEPVVDKEAKSTVENETAIILPTMSEVVLLPSASEAVLLPSANVESMEEDERSILALPYEVLLLPYEKLQVPYSNTMEETGTWIGNSRSDMFSSIEEDNVTLFPEQDEAGLDGFSQLFAEEERSVSANDGENGSESLDNIGQEDAMDAIWEAHSIDHVKEENGKLLFSSIKEIEFQDKISPMSLEGCLVDFTKLELLCGEDAWECENCCRAAIAESLSTATYAGNKNLLQSHMDPKASMERTFEKEKTVHNRGKSSLTEGEISSSKDFLNKEMNHHTANNSPFTDCRTSLSSASVENMSVLLKEKDIHCFNRSCDLEWSLEGKDGKADTRMTEIELKSGNGFFSLNDATGNDLSAQQSPLTTMAGGFATSNSNNSNNSNNLRCMEENNASGGLDECGERYVEEDESKVGKNEVCGSFDEVKKKEYVKSSGYEQGKLHYLDTRDPCSEASSSVSVSEISSIYHSPRKSALQKQKSKMKNTKKTVKQDATKRLLISKAPPILTIHLKRFGQDMRGHLSKLSGHVAFQEWLDLRPFLDPKCLDDKNYIYRLVGIVEHAGTMRGGHYVSYVSSSAMSDAVSKSQRDILGDVRNWYCISDSNVRKATLQAVLNSEAYLLFYEKCVPI